MTKHTPGPWVVQQTTPGGWIAVMADRREIGFPFVATCNHDDLRRDEATRLANARLIAEAPAMLALLREFTNWEAYMGGFDGEIWQQARDLIRRVDGVAPEKVEG